MDNKQSEAEFRELWDVITGIARTAMYVPVEDVEKLLRTVDRARTLGPIIEPTMYQRGSKNLDDQETLARGFLAFRKAIEEVRPK